MLGPVDSPAAPSADSPPGHPEARCQQAEETRRREQDERRGLRAGRQGKCRQQWVHGRLPSAGVLPHRQPVLPVAALVVDLVHHPADDQEPETSDGGVIHAPRCSAGQAGRIERWSGIDQLDRQVVGAGAQAGFDLPGGPLAVAVLDDVLAASLAASWQA